MGFLQSEIKKRRIPELFGTDVKGGAVSQEFWRERREQIKELLSGQFTGYATRLSFKTNGTVVREEQNGFGGKAVVKTVQLDIRSDFSHAAFPFQIALPKKAENPPLFLYLSFTPEIADGIGEEILDEGYAIASVCYQDMAPDYYDEHKNGLGRFCTRNPFDSWGKLKIWSWGASRILDYILENESIDEERAAVMGHSRLGKTALLAGAFDERFSLTSAIQSGAGGAALFRGKSGEQIENLNGKGSRLWFAGNFFEYLGKTEELPFDQHFLLSLTAPRHLYVSSAAEDGWADPRSEFLGCAAASKAFELYGKKGLVTPDKYPETGDVLCEGSIGYHMREGTHYLSRDDWHRVMDYRSRHHV